MTRTARVNECGHPDRPHMARGRCASCYDAARFRGLLGAFTLTQRPNPDLVRRAEALRAELEAAAAYSGQPFSWRVIAERLGVKEKTLEKARERARRRRGSNEEAA